MYIWILLATFMIALSFLNLSPRQDKQSVFSEIKAASHINRFRAEHVAATRTMECELLYNGSRYSSEYLISPDLNVGYTSVSNNLPLGYDTTVNIGEVFHYAYCFKKPISDEAELSTNCGSSEDRYVISFVQLPARWISKEETKIKIGNVEDSVITPLPAYTNFLAKELTGVKNTGWLWCGSDSKCHLAGRATLQTINYVETSGNDKSNVMKYVKFTFPKAILDNTNFKNKCNSGLPCLFAFDKLHNSDKNMHCKNLMRANTGI